MALTLCAVLLAGTESLAADAQRGSSSKKPKPPKDSPAQVLAPSKEQSGGWCIVLETFTGDTALADAKARLPHVARLVGRSDVSIRTTERGAALVCGNYADRESPDAVEDLKNIRALAVDGARPFARAMLVPPKRTERVDLGSQPQFNLLAARQTFGDDAQYTLQIGFYQSKDPAERKRAAERAAVALRQKGEIAFYYHDTEMSLVTVGVFSDDDFDPTSLRPVNPKLLQLQQKHPRNLHNGNLPIIEKRQGEPDREQPSFLVRIPSGS
ncbi:MAG: hypothetical protein SFZ24_00785 [Planctomycetota bacterium]|nr:hypothetical protein [Planctomycetota bacterium]